jgi:hypothetical protein
MPLRANVEHEPAPTPDLKPGTEVWACRFTGEIFERYSDYIAAIALYRQRIWTCEFTGKQSLTFEEALESELGATKWIDMFPQSHFLALLKRVQFNTKRIEELTTDVFDHFSEHYVEGQELDVLDGNDVKKIRIVREVTSDAGAAGAAGGGDEDEMDMDVSMSAGPSTQYEVVWLDQPDRADTRVDEEAIMKPEQKVPASKSLIKNAIRAVASKLNWGSHGGPWVVRGSIAEEYSIDKQMPATLKREHEDWLNRAEIAKKAKREAAAESAEERKARERAEKARRAEEERLRKIEEFKYPMADELLAAEGVQQPPLVLPTSLAMHMRTTGPNFSRAVTVWSALNTFSRWWNLHPFTFEDFDQALHHGPCALLSEAFVSVLRVVVQQARSDAEHEASRSKQAKAGEEELSEHRWVSDEWILEVEPGSLDPGGDNWEDTLRKYLDFAAQQALTKRLEFVQNRDFAKLACDHQPWLKLPIKWEKDDDPLSDKHHVVYDPSFPYPADENLASSGELDVKEEGEGGDGSSQQTQDPENGTAAAPAENQESSSSEPPAAVAPAAEAGIVASEPAVGSANIAGVSVAPAEAAATAAVANAGGDDMDMDEPSTEDQPLYTAAELKALLMSIVQITKEAHDGTRSRAELFFDLPSEEHYPDYYEIVKTPISMRMIIEKTEQGSYTTPESFRDDWMLLQENAYLYNPDGSVLRNDADFFVTVVQQKLAQFEALKKEESTGGAADGSAGTTIMRMNGLRIPDLSGIARGALAGFQAPLDVTLEVLSFLVEEALGSEPSRMQLESTLEQADVVRKELREEQMALNQQKKDEREKIKEAEERAEAAAAAAAEAAANGEEVEMPSLEPDAPPDPLAGLRASNDALVMKETEMMSRQELVIHNKALKESSDRLRREEIALANAAKKEQAAERKKLIDQRRKMNAYITLLEELQVRGKALGFDRDRNRYWLLRPKEPATVDDSLLFVELNRGSFTETNAFCQPLTDTPASAAAAAESINAGGVGSGSTLAGAVAANGNGTGAPLSDRWVQVVSDAEFTALVDSLEVKVCLPPR